MTITNLKQYKDEKIAEDATKRVDRILDLIRQVDSNIRILKRMRLEVIRGQRENGAKEEGGEEET